MNVVVVVDWNTFSIFTFVCTKVKMSSFNSFFVQQDVLMFSLLIALFCVVLVSLVVMAIASESNRLGYVAIALVCCFMIIILSAALHARLVGKKTRQDVLVASKVDNSNWSGGICSPQDVYNNTTKKCESRVNQTTGLFN